MAATRFDVLGIGNAIVDVIARTDDAFLAKQKMRKGTMRLIDEAQAAGLYDAMGPAVEDSVGQAAKIAHDAERDVALTLSDAFCVDRYRAEFLDLIRAGTVDLVFANERELHSLYETADFDTALDALRKDARLAVITRSERGCLIVTREETDAVPASPVERVVDATGAGDLFAAGFLVGLSRGAEYRDAARLGALVAAEVIQHLGARPETSLKALAQDNGFDL